MNEKEERDLKVLAAPAEDKCAGFARALPQRLAGGDRQPARQTDAPTAAGPGQGPQERHARAPDVGPTAGSSSGEALAGRARAPAPLQGARPHRPHPRLPAACSGPRTDGGGGHLLSGSRSAPARDSKLRSRRPGGFQEAARRGDVSPLAGLSRARL